MKISVVIPVFNEEALIKRCLAALLNQTKKPFEIIVVDNNSTDLTATIAKSYGARVIQEKQQGMIYARNAGFSAAAGEIIARIDADTTVPKDWIEKINRHFIQDPNLIALSGPTFFEDAKFNHLLIVEPILIASWKLIFGHDLLYGPNYVVCKKAWEKIKNTVCLNDKLVHEDFDMAIHLGRLKMGKILFDKKFTVEVSERRWRKAKSYLEYPQRYLKTIAQHKKFY
jgi:glycosyltransferase involved in cell wall biosynthesis